MQVACPKCGHVLDFSGERPSFCAYCGKPLSTSGDEATRDFDPEATRPAVTLPSGEVSAAPWSVGNYRLLKPLGGGGMGTVYEAEDRTSSRHVALKLIAPEYSASPDAVERFRQEGRLASLIAHPRCVFVLGADEEGGRPYIVMELMPGKTLQELADRRGPLPVEEAIAITLDVIEGLQEAHRLGVIHRDVKPSNCFVQPDGRVKVGDFGLAKSLVGGSNLTKSGTFLGTLLYAPPEQIKGEDIDFRTDVYSVAATLYHLLTGRPPFHGTDPAATLARTVSESPPPPRDLRPDLSRTLERAILRGLERDPSDRWSDLEELRRALLPFGPGRVTAAGLGARVGAAVIDFLLIMPLWVFLLLVLAGEVGESPAPSRGLLIHLLELLPLGILEGVWGWSPGKRLLRLRVSTATGFDPPGLWRGLLRAGAFYACIWLPSDAVIGIFSGDEVGTAPALVGGFLELLGFVLLISTMRARTGYRGLHEWLSGTRVVRLPWPERRHSYAPRQPARAAVPFPAPEELPARLGPYHVRGVLRREGVELLLAGEDAVLGRSVWLRAVREGGPALPGWRRGLTRPTRLPWLTGGTQDGWAWDAFLAPQGSPLAELVDARAPMTWGQFRPLLLQLADELAAACADASLPQPVSAAQVWVAPGGRVQLLDGPPPGVPAGVELKDPEDAARALALLRQVTALALEGRERTAPRGAPIHAPVPARVALVLDRLTGAEEPYREVEQLQSDLIALQSEPPEVDAATRSAHLALLFMVLAPALLMMFAPRYLVLHHTFKDLIDRKTTLEAALAEFRNVGKDNELLRALQANAVLKGIPLPEWQGSIGVRLEEDRKRLQSLRQSVQWDWLMRYLLPEPYWRPDAEAPPAVLSGVAVVEQAARRTLEAPGESVEGALLVVYLLILIPPLWCVLWALATRGGFTFRLIGITVCRGSGRPALRVQCAWRALLFWFPVAVLLCLSVWVQIHLPGRPALSFGLWASAVGVLVGYMLLAIWFPTRSLHDRLAGTYLVPK